MGVRNTTWKKPPVLMAKNLRFSVRSARPPVTEAKTSGHSGETSGLEAKTSGVRTDDDLDSTQPLPTHYQANGGAGAV